MADKPTGIQSLESLSAQLQDKNTVTLTHQKRTKNPMKALGFLNKNDARRAARCATMKKFTLALRKGGELFYPYQWRILDSEGFYLTARGLLSRLAKDPSPEEREAPTRWLRVRIPQDLYRAMVARRKLTGKSLTQQTLEALGYEPQAS